MLSAITVITSSPEGKNEESFRFHLDDYPNVSIELLFFPEEADDNSQ